MYRYLEAYPRLKTYLKVAKFEIKLSNKEAAREVYERAITDLGEEALDQRYFIEFAKFETKNKEVERSRNIYRYGLENIPKDKAY